MSCPTVVSSVHLGPPEIERLRDHQLRVVDFAQASRRDLAEALEDAEGLLIDSHLTADSALLELAPHLRALSTISVGLDHIDLAATSQRAITVTHTPVLSDAVADLTLVLILMTARRLGEAVDIVASGGWDDALLGTDLHSKTLLIVGLGRIGQEVAQRALAEHRLAGAGLDVLENEPPGTGEPLLEMPNVVVLPHIGSATVETRHAMLDCAVANLAACLRGEHCEHTVKPASFRAP